MKRLLSIILAIGLLSQGIYVVSAASTISEMGLVAFWDFNEGTGRTINDLSGNGFTAVIDEANVGKYVWEKGFEGAAIRTTEADSGIVHPDVRAHILDKEGFFDELYGAKQISYDFMMKRTSPNANLQATDWFFYAEATNVVLRLGTDQNWSYAGFRSQSGDGLGGGTLNMPSDYGWHHYNVVVDFENKRVLGYVDGVLKTEVTGRNTMTSDFFGYCGDDATNLYLLNNEAVIDDFKVYNRQLTEEEIRKNIPAAARWDFEECDDGTASDIYGYSTEINIDVEDYKIIYGAENYTVSFSETTAETPYAAGSDCSSLGIGLNGSLGLSFEARIKKNSNEQTQEESLFLLRNTANKAVLEVKLTADGYISLNGKSAATDTCTALLSNTKVSSSGWQHVICSLDFKNKKAYIYVNGVLDNQGNMAFSADTYSGGLKTSGGIRMSGKSADLDSVVLYKTPLDAADAYTLYKDRPNANYIYRLTDDDGNEIQDLFVATDGKINAYIDFYNSSDEATEIVFFTVVYDAQTDALCGGDMVTNEGLVHGGESIQLKSSIEVETGGKYKIRSFVWNSLGGMKPLADVFELK